METKFIRALVALGVPGVALGIFYLLLRAFSFQFSQVDATWTATIVIIFLLIVGAITFYALHRWAPERTPSIPEKSSQVFEYKMDEETATYTEKLTSLALDVVKINAHTHYLGVAAEYAWIDHNYPNSEKIMQSLTTLELVTGNEGYKPGQVHFDVIKIKLPNGREKEIYFDISSFFNGVASSLLNSNKFIAQKISELYKPV